MSEEYTVELFELGLLRGQVMLNISGNDVKDLNDTDLRSLVGLLCEAELARYDLPSAGVTWGGHQNAPDGGIDVRVQVAKTPHSDSYIPRANTAFQVKKPDMPRAAIIDEMKPRGVLRGTIKELADSSGAYIIVCSQGSTSESALRAREDAMYGALSELPNASNIEVRFYDRERIAGWARSHPAISLWIREKLGRPIQGWQPYGNWTKSPEGAEGEYILDDDFRLYGSSSTSSEGMSAIEGIHAIRKILNQPSSSVRLTGLSGVGKTRLLLALFDDRIGVDPLNTSQVFYTDISDSPTPSPRIFSEQLIALRKPSVLIVDNCPPDLHRRLTSVCAASGSLVSLITVEYDVRDDQPEETDVFRLEPSSIGLIEKVVRTRFKHISQVDSHSISELSGGNARIAIALAATVQKGDNLSSLKDEDLFERLFYQRNIPDRELLKTAEVCSLVYSFKFNADEGEDLELQILSSLADISARKLYEHVSELKRRDLVQKRGMWRAVLPHALANRLAQRALENIPLVEIFRLFEQKKSERILISFSRRLGYLHNCDRAEDIASKWLSDEGLLADIRNLNDLEIKLFKNIAPIHPEATLCAIEKAANDYPESFLSRENVHFIDFSRLLRSLAYEGALFERSVSLLCKIALSEKPDEKNNSVRDLFKSLFYIYLSGTHASVQQRLSVISELLKSEEKNQINLAIELLDAALECWHFSRHHGFEFGTRSRDYGYRPKSKEESDRWFSLFIELTLQHATSESEFSPLLKGLLANKFRGLWSKTGIFDCLENAAKVINDNGGWNEGWVAVKKTLRFDKKRMDAGLVVRLENLAKLLAPGELIERVKLYVLTRRGNALDLIDAVEDGLNADSYSRAEEIARSLGQQILNDEGALRKLFPELLGGNGGRLFSFGQGLADACQNPLSLWNDFRGELAKIPADERNYGLLGGYLGSLEGKHPGVVNEILNTAIEDQVLGSVFPVLQASVSIDVPAIQRLKSSLSLSIAPIWQFNQLAYGRVHETISDNDLCEILKLISEIPDGVVVAINILQMRLHRNTGEKLHVSSAILTVGQDLLLKYNFKCKNRNADHDDYGLARIIEACFVDTSATCSAEILCKELAKGIDNYEICGMDFGEVLVALATMQPIAFLDGFLGDDVEHNRRYDRIFYEDIGSRINPLSKIDDDLIVEWCESNPTIKYPLAATAIIPYQKCDLSDSLEWTPLALMIIANSSDPATVLKEFMSAFRPTSWSGSRADIMQSRLCLIENLQGHDDPVVSEWAVRVESDYIKEIASEREWELKRGCSQDESFE